MDHPLLSRCMAENKGWGLDDLKTKVHAYQQISTSTTPDPDGRAYEVVTPPAAVDASKNNDCISAFPSSIHSNSNEHDAFYVQVAVEEVEQEVNEPIYAYKTIVFGLYDIKDNEPQRHAQCCMAQLSSSSWPWGKLTRRSYV